ncbi:hypothetical protein [Gynuella sunshinyii]|uniref:Helix-turn-helix domain-containing protein n=1 Tax=Gynuella sunshinyii YC6258 TaxID=1445510 RepID=A0A0C5VZH8_9GAMM|nr:hypothetical protein [Gynuella sunshinyii]AJQ95819.1 hypothetical Protein YC6258_03783 [Gynuella sunshinyii YC6258]
MKQKLNDLDVVSFEVGLEMTPEKYSEMSGVPLGVLRGWMDRGHIPTVKRGKYRLIDGARLVIEARIRVDEAMKKGGK